MRKGVDVKSAVARGTIRRITLRQKKPCTQPMCLSFCAVFCCVLPLLREHNLAKFENKQKRGAETNAECQRINANELILSATENLRQVCTGEGGGEGSHLPPRLVQKVAGRKPSCEWNWTVDMMTKTNRNESKRSRKTRAGGNIVTIDKNGERATSRVHGFQGGKKTSRTSKAGVRFSPLQEDTTDV